MTIQKGEKIKLVTALDVQDPAGRKINFKNTFFEESCIEVQKFYSLFIIGPIKLFPTKICIGN